MSRADPLAVLERALAPEVVAAITALVDERVTSVQASATDRLQAFDGRPWLTTQEAAQALGVTPEAIRMRVRRGRLRGRHQGSRLYIATDSILDLGPYPADASPNQSAPATRKRPGARTRKDKLS